MNHDCSLSTWLPFIANSLQASEPCQQAVDLQSPPLPTQGVKHQVFDSACIAGINSSLRVKLGFGSLVRVSLLCSAIKFAFSLVSGGQEPDPTLVSHKEHWCHRTNKVIFPSFCLHGDSGTGEVGAGCLMQCSIPGCLPNFREEESCFLLATVVSPLTHFIERWSAATTQTFQESG